VGSAGEVHVLTTIGLLEVVDAQMFPAEEVEISRQTLV
jgi:hypothetical protein